MEFRLYYRGLLKANRPPAEKHQLRRHFHVQLKELWKQEPLTAHPHLLNPVPDGINPSLVQSFGVFQFVPLVSERIGLIAELNILLLRPEPPGSIVTKGGDIDNRLKTLLDALKTPREPNDLPSTAKPEAGESPFFCLLQDDNLITSLSVTSDRLLDNPGNPSEVVLIIHVHTKAAKANLANIGLG